MLRSLLRERIRIALYVVAKSIDCGEEKKDKTDLSGERMIVLPGAADGTTMRKIICAARKGIACALSSTQKLTDDYCWHEYLMLMIQKASLKIHIFISRYAKAVVYQVDSYEQSEK